MNSPMNNSVLGVNFDNLVDWEQYDESVGQKSQERVTSEHNLPSTDYFEVFQHSSSLPREDANTSGSDLESQQTGITNNVFMGYEGDAPLMDYQPQQALEPTFDLDSEPSPKSQQSLLEQQYGGTITPPTSTPGSQEGDPSVTLPSHPFRYKNGIIDPSPAQMTTTPPYSPLISNNSPDLSQVPQIPMLGYGRKAYAPAYRHEQTPGSLSQGYRNLNNRCQLPTPPPENQFGLHGYSFFPEQYRSPHGPVGQYDQRPAHTPMAPYVPNAYQVGLNGYPMQAQGPAAYSPVPAVDSNMAAYNPALAANNNLAAPRQPATRARGRPRKHPLPDPNNKKKLGRPAGSEDTYPRLAKGEKKKMTPEKYRALVKLLKKQKADAQ